MILTTMQPHAVALLLLLSTFAEAQRTFWRDSYQLNFDYDPESGDGPHDWGDVTVDGSEFRQFDVDHNEFNLDVDGNECDRDFRPSPIPLVANSGCTDDHEIRTRQIDEDDDCTRADVSYELTPHVLRAYFPEDDDDCERPSIELDEPDDDDFIIVWMEVHARSEHVVDGKRFDAELQMFHMGTGDSDDEMAIVSVFLEATARQDHEEFQFMLDGWQSTLNRQEALCDQRYLRVHKQVQENALKKKNGMSSRKKESTRKEDKKKERELQNCQGDDCGPRRKKYPYNMWPSIHYFSYDGSITYPPCTTAVNWRILDKPMEISRKQYKQLTNLLTSYRNDDCDRATVTSPRGENARPLQTINEDQDVAHCTIDDFDLDLYGPGNQ